MKLLIVDDETRTRELLRNHIHWQSIGIVEVQTARNGLLALEIAMQWKPDIILCDVLMPKMNGIDFARKYREHDVDCKIIFLSGFSDKEYLMSAIHLKAQTYLEKPVNLDEVRSAVESAIQLRSIELVKQTEETKMLEDYDRSLPVLRREMVRKLITDPSSKHVAPALRSQDTFLLPSEGPYTVAAAMLFWNPSDLPQEPALVQELLLDAFNQNTFFISQKILCGFNAHHLMVLIIPGSYGSTYREGREFIEEVTSELKTLVGDLINLRLGIGKPAHSITDIPNAYKSALLASSLQFYGNAAKPMFFDAVGNNQPIETDWTKIRILREKLKDKDIAGTRAMIQDWTLYAHKQLDLNIIRLKDTYFQFLFTIVETAILLGYAEQTEDMERGYIWKEMERIPSLEALKRYVLEFLDLYVRSMTEKDSIGMGKMREIIKYIRLHCNERSFTIRVIADHCKLSETYLSSYFKKQQGITIKEYITELRLNNAKELLRNMDLKLYEVADQLGFEDANYFTTFFKRYEGSTPSEYRERLT
ncbi:response regulator [Paenibacillus psychroresistens]|uniref:Response regulator n=1 Tax=Paenibacillus psychroresistens TaxID=1778678 RepID=A0A6B8RYZ0_9BACL|nr:response regulator [Paenibacillus psychroresistens]